MIVKRKRRQVDEELSEDDEDDDPYTHINIEGNKARAHLSAGAYATRREADALLFFPSDILSPIEIPTDIVRRPALRRIIKTTQIEGLAHTAMEFIEGEKNFTKILSRLSAILHHDDPQYLDLNFERTAQERKRRKIAESEKDTQPASEQKSEATEDDNGPDIEAQEVVQSVRELLLVSLFFQEPSIYSPLTRKNRKISISVMNIFQNCKAPEIN